MSAKEEAFGSTILKEKNAYDEECENMLKSRKKDMTSDLYGLITNLKEKKNIKEFIEAKIDDLDKKKLFYSDLKDNKGKFTIIFLVKIIGFLFLTSNITGIYQLIGIQESLEEEVFDSVKFYFNGNATNNSINFYQKVYSNNTKKLPGLSFFFILSFLSDIIIKLISFPVITIIMLVLNTVIFYFLYNFEFLEEEKLLNENYSLFHFTLLVLYLLYFSIILGIIALLPMNIFSAGYFYYEQNLMRNIRAKNEKKENIINNDDKDDNNENNIIIKNDMKNDININDDKKNINNISITQFCSDENNKINNIKKENVTEIYARDSSSFFLEVNDIREEKIKEPEKREIYIVKNNGYYISYLLAFLIAITIRLYSNTEDIITEHRYLYINLIKFHFIPILISLIFYIIFSCAFSKEKADKSDICITQFCGYLIFQEKKARKKSICCGGCRTGFRKFNIVICKIFCCSRCCFCDCCKCEKCCFCSKEEDDLTDTVDRDKALCFCYKISGKCSWICDYFTDLNVFLITLMMTGIELYNFGFKSLLNEYIRDLDYKRNYSDSEANKELNIIHIIYLVGIVFYYIFNIIFGRIYYSALPLGKITYFGEGFMIGLGIMALVVFESIISCVFSSIIYYDHAESVKYYLMAFSISSVEYVKLSTLSFIAKGSDNKSNLFGYSSFISILLTIERSIISLFDSVISDHMNFVFFQFILAIITGFLGLCFSCCLLCFKKIMKKSEEMYEKSKEQDELLEKLRKEKGELLAKKAFVEMVSKMQQEDEEKKKSVNDDDE